MGCLFFKSSYDDLKIINSKPTHLLDLPCIDINGKEGLIGDYLKNKKAIMFVNVACSCGLTSNHYKQLQDLYSKYSSQGLEILGFPCNQFMKQESRIESEIKEYVSKKFNAQFPLFSKIEVNGKNTNAIYVYLKQNTPEFNDKTKGLKNIPWNFAKFLVDPTGTVIGYFGPSNDPNEMIPLIEKSLS